MKITAVTSCKGAPKVIEPLIEGSRVSAEVHKVMGAKNPRLLRAVLADKSIRKNISDEKHQ